jgi:pyruvate/oxaloacetate carboxyltransferase
MLHIFAPILSDQDVKRIHKAGGDIKDIAAAIIEHGPPFSAQEVETLVKASGLQDHDGEWDDDTLSKYAQHIRNYKYTYTDEAKTVDPNIDTSVEHNGPMAQDIEKVNPAAVVDDPKTGYKTVDTGRLALMNAGAIADLAREVEALKK